MLNVYLNSLLILAKLANPKKKVQNGRSERNGVLFIGSSF